jgi:hypothetical protein
LVFFVLIEFVRSHKRVTPVRSLQILLIPMLDNILRAFSALIFVGCMPIFVSNFAFAENCNIPAGELCPFSETFDYFLPADRPNNPSIKFGQVTSIIKSKSQKNSSVSNLSDDEKVAIFGFTQEFYIPINIEIRRNSDSNLIPKHNYDFYIQVLDSALSKLPPFVGVTTRDVDLPANVLTDHYVGNVVKYMAYTSSSRLSVDRENWRYYRTHLHFIIQSLTGRDIEDYAAKPEEQEVLFSRNTNFRVEARKKIDCSTQHLPTAETCYEIQLQEVKK